MHDPPMASTALYNLIFNSDGDPGLLALPRTGSDQTRLHRGVSTQEQTDAVNLRVCRQSASKVIPIVGSSGSIL